MSGAFVAVVPASAQSVELSREEKAVIGKRLARVVNYKQALSLESGDTLFVVRKVAVPEKRITGPLADYEGIATGLRGAPGLLIDERIDEVRLEPARQGRIEVTFRYALVAMPEARSGDVSFKLQLIQRTGLGETIVTVPLQHRVTVTPPKPTAVDLTADFWGYRIYAALARERLEQLGKKGVKGLSIRADARLPPMMGLSREVATETYELDKWRRRMWIAYRHLVAAKGGGDRSLAALADRYLRLLDTPDAELGELPKIPLVGGDQAAADAAVEKLGQTPPPAKAPDGTEVLTPLGPTPARPADPAPPPRDKPVTPAKPAAKEPTVEAKQAEDPLEARAEIPIPSHPRFLILDDPNIAFGGWVRVHYAKVTTQETAFAPAAFAGAQAALTPDLGAELTVPVAYVDLDVDRARPLATVGNPLVALHYRLRLPDVGGDRPGLSFRARWGIPVSPLSTVPPTNLGAEDFSFPAHFADTYAFLLEKHALSLAVATSWRLGILHTGAQLNVDYYTAVKGSLTDTSFAGLGYGASFGVRPFGEILGAYVEARGASLFVGPGRTEVFTYAGVRARLAQLFEPALWVSLPIGSVGSVSGFQFGAELRLAHDVDAIIVRGRGRRGYEYGDFE